MARKKNDHAELPGIEELTWEQMAELTYGDFVLLNNLPALYRVDSRPIVLTKKSIPKARGDGEMTMFLVNTTTGERKNWGIIKGSTLTKVKL